MPRVSRFSRPGYHRPCQSQKTPIFSVSSLLRSSLHSGHTVPHCTSRYARRSLRHAQRTDTPLRRRRPAFHHLQLLRNTVEGIHTRLSKNARRGPLTMFLELEPRHPTRTGAASVQFCAIVPSTGASLGTKKNKSLGPFGSAPSLLASLHQTPQGSVRCSYFHSEAQHEYDHNPFQAIC